MHKRRYGSIATCERNRQICEYGDFTFKNTLKIFVYGVCIFPSHRTASRRPGVPRDIFIND
jgi:hypothetical protein